MEHTGVGTGNEVTGVLKTRHEKLGTHEGNAVFTIDRTKILENVRDPRSPRSRY